MIKYGKDYASMRNGGCNQNKNGISNIHQMLRDDFSNYTGSTGFTYTPSVGQAIIIEFNALYYIDTVKLILWDKDTRTYRYKIEVSSDDIDYSCVVDMSNEDRHGLQEHRFDPRVVKYIRIYNNLGGTSRVAHLCIVKLWAYYQIVD